MGTFPTIKTLLKSGQLELQQAQIEKPALESRILLAHAIGCSQEQLLINANECVSPDATKKFLKLIERRKKLEPIAYLLGKKEFYGFDFIVNKHVLIPRPESETLIEVVLSKSETCVPCLPGSPRFARDDGCGGDSTKFISTVCSELPDCARNFPSDRHPERSVGIQDIKKNLNILDLGTGSGCLILTLLKSLPSAKGIALDISKQALKVARANAKSLGVRTRVKFVNKSWTAFNSKQKFDLIVSNPPYIKQKDITGLSKDVSHFEPHLALNGGKDGLNCYKTILPIAKKLLKPNGVCVLECGQGQHKSIAKIANNSGLIVMNYQKDLLGIVRCVVLETN